MTPYVSEGKDTEDAGRFSPSRKHLAGCQAYTLINPAFLMLMGHPTSLPAAFLAPTLILWKCSKRLKFIRSLQAQEETLTPTQIELYFFWELRRGLLTSLMFAFSCVCLPLFLTVSFTAQWLGGRDWPSILSEFQIPAQGWYPPLKLFVREKMWIKKDLGWTWAPKEKTDGLLQPSLRDRQCQRGPSADTTSQLCFALYCF